MVDSGISSDIGLILFHLVFLVFGLIIIYVATNTAENLSTMIFGIIFDCNVFNTYIYNYENNKNCIKNIKWQICNCVR